MPESPARARAALTSCCENATIRPVKSTPRVFLNVDAGELEDEPIALYAAAHAVSIACGGHAGDDASMRRVLEACARAGTGAGAHPSYVDREGFGRTAQVISAAALEDAVYTQCARLAAIASRIQDDDSGAIAITHVKPHGALYHAANADDDAARAVVRGATRALGRAVLVVGPPEGALRRASDALGLDFAREGFADRGTRPDGSLVPRGMPGAVITDEATVRANARALAASGSVDTICVHGDSPGSLALARAVRAELDARR
jgi:5-oxoprolinase (ATP-hydrolysing) subunit A